MGNYIFRSPLFRKNLSKMLMILPQWILPTGWRQDRPLALTNIEERHSLPIDNDSTLISTPFADQSNMISQQLIKNQRRMTFTCPDTNAVHIKALTDEIKALRETVACLVYKNINVVEKDDFELVKKVEEPQEDWKDVDNEENFIIKRRCKSFMEVKKSLKYENKNDGKFKFNDKQVDPTTKIPINLIIKLKFVRPDLRHVLKDLENVKLRPVNSSTPKFVPENDLQDILRKRFSAMHSPLYLKGPNSNLDNKVEDVKPKNKYGDNHNDSYGNGSDDISASFEY